MARRLKDEGVVDSHTFKAKLLDYMEREEITQLELARRLGVGRMTVSRWLSVPKRRPTLPAVIRFAYLSGEHPLTTMKDAGYPIPGPTPSDYRERTNRILDRKPQLEHAIHRLDLLDPAWQGGVLAVVEALLDERSNGLEPLSPPE